MAQCQADLKKHGGNTRFDLYGGIFSGQIYGGTIGNGQVDPVPNYLRAADYNDVPSNRFNGVDNFAQENQSRDGFRQESGLRAAARGGSKSESPNSGGHGLERRRSTGGMMGQSPGLASPEVSPVQGTKGGGIQSGVNKNLLGIRDPSRKGSGELFTAGTPPFQPSRKSSGELFTTGAPPFQLNRKSSGELFTAGTPPFQPVRKSSGEIFTTGTPPFQPSRKSSGELFSAGTPPFHNHSRKSSGELSNERVHVKGIHADGFAFGEIIKGVGNLCDDSSSGGLKSSDLDSGSASSKGRSPRAESPKSIGSSSSGGSSSGGSPTVGRIVNFGNILPHGVPVKTGTSPTSNPAASISGRGVHSIGVSGHAPVPVPTSGSLQGSRRSNSWDYTAGIPKAAHARSGSEPGSNGPYTGANVAASPRHPLSTSPSGSAYGSPVCVDNLKAGRVSENLVIRNALANMDPEVVKNAGNDQYKKGYFTEALNLYDKAISMAPEKAAYRSNRAAALTGLGRLPEAVQECLHAIGLDPSYARAHHRLGTLYLRLGQVDNATRHFRAAGSQTEWADTQRSMAIEKHLWKCKDARKAQDWQTVLKETDASIIAGADSSPLVMAYKAEALLKLHKPEEADTAMSNVRRVEDTLKRTSLAQTYSMVLLVQAQVDMALGRFDNAVAAAEKASQFAPSDVAATVLLRKAKTVAKAREVGNDLFKAGKFSEAVIVYGEGLESAPKNAVLLCNRAACRSKLNQWEKAVEDSNAALEEQPNYTKALLRRAQSYAKLERWEDASRDYEILRRQCPGDAEVARALFDVQVSLKKSKGEDTHKIRRFGGDIVEITANDQYQEAITAPGLAVVQFSTRWSERSREMMPFVEDLCKRHLSITFVKVDVDDQPYLSKSENVSFVPTFKIYKNGSKIKELPGPTHEELERAVNLFSS